MMVVPQHCVRCYFLYLCFSPPCNKGGTTEIGEKDKRIGVSDRKSNGGAMGCRVHFDGFHVGIVYVGEVGCRAGLLAF